MAMSIFGKKAAESNPATDHRDACLQMALAQEAMLRAEQPALLKSLYVEHGSQCAGFSWEIHRHGDFLLVELHRTANAGHKKWSSAVNLTKVSRIYLAEGRLPREDGTFNWFASRDFKTGNPEVMFFDRPMAPVHRWFCNEDAPSPSFYPMFAGAPVHTTYNYPVPAQDEVIHFVGAGLGLRAPAHFGTELLNAIVAGIGAGYEEVANA